MSLWPPPEYPPKLSPLPTKIRPVDTWRGDEPVRRVVQADPATDRRQPGSTGRCQPVGGRRDGRDRALGRAVEVVQYRAEGVHSPVAQIGRQQRAGAHDHPQQNGVVLPLGPAARIRCSIVGTTINAVARYAAIAFQRRAARRSGGGTRSSPRARAP